MIRDSFDYHVPRAPGLAQINAQRDAAKAMRSIIEQLPPGRERSLAMTKLEEALMWANKAASAIPEVES